MIPLTRAEVRELAPGRLEMTAETITGSLSKRSRTDFRLASLNASIRAPYARSMRRLDRRTYHIAAKTIPTMAPVQISQLGTRSGGRVDARPGTVFR